MEEHVGEIWHRLISRLAETRHWDAAVQLDEVRHALGIFFRALGGDGGLEVEAADAHAAAVRRTWLQRIAGTGRKPALAWRDERALYLPPVIAWFADQDLNRDLYFWLAALAAAGDSGGTDWVHANQLRTRHVLKAFPGLRGRYRRLVDAHLAQRPEAARLRSGEAAMERSICQALADPDSVVSLPAGDYPVAAVPLWLHPDPPAAQVAVQPDHADQGAGNDGAARQAEDSTRRRAGRVDDPAEEGGLLTVRMENIFTMGEYVSVDRGSEEEEDLDRAENIARDLDQLSVARNARATAGRLKFDLDLPPAAGDDLVLDTGILLPEWDWRRRELLPDRCRVVSMLADTAAPRDLPEHLSRTARRLRNQFQALTPARTWRRGRQDGQEIDIDAYLRFAADRAAGHGVGGDALYRELHRGARDLDCLLLADLSLSTDTWISNRHRVIDVIRDSLYLFAESLQATGDRFAMYGFSSRKRDPVRFHQLKAFDARYDARIRGRIDAIKPGYYTRLGAGIRHATDLLKVQAASKRLLLVLTDGKPNDLDQYEGRYGIEDTRHAIFAARQLGLQPFCVTIDEQGNDYLPHLFGAGGYVVIHKPEELPRKLPQLYARLTAG